MIPGEGRELEREQQGQSVASHRRSNSLWRALPSQRKVTVALEVLKIYAIGSAELFVCDQIQ